MKFKIKVLIEGLGDKNYSQKIKQKDTEMDKRRKKIRESIQV